METKKIKNVICSTTHYEIMARDPDNKIDWDIDAAIRYGHEHYNEHEPQFFSDPETAIKELKFRCELHGVTATFYMVVRVHTVYEKIE